jgi:hypothetical protein
MYFPDLGTETQIDSGDHVRAVGWLSSAQPFSQGEVPAEFISKLRALSDNWGAGLDALWWPAAGGFHECEFCGGSRASGNLGVPMEMICHYVESHGYRPPDPFVHAVLASPIPGSADYARAVARFREFNLQRYRRLFPDDDVS